MSGIEEMTQKIKKKLSLEDLGPVQLDAHTATHTAVQTVKHQSENKTETPSVDPQQSKPVSVNTASQQYSKPQYNRKVTLYLTEEMYKAFNDIYAQRILQGRKTDKTVLICEAIQLLHEQESRKL